MRGPTAEEIRVATMDVEERNPLKLLPAQESNMNVSGTEGMSHNVHRWTHRQTGYSHPLDPA
jgi:hypothetical protein